MRKSLLSILIAIFLILSVSTSLPVFADSPQILRNPGFEDDIDYWISAVTATLVAMKSFEGVTPQAGDFFVYTDNRYGYADAPMQHIANQMNFYGQGTYQFKAYMRLPESSSASTAKAEIVVQTVSADKKSGGAQFPGMNWYTTVDVTINKTSWTLLQTTVDIQWSQTLEACEFYFLTKQGDPVTNICIDSASMIKVGYNGPSYGFPTPTPPKNSPTPRSTPTNPPVTLSAPGSSTASSSRYVYSKTYSSSSTANAGTTSSSSTSDPNNSEVISQDTSSDITAINSVSGISGTISINSSVSINSQAISNISSVSSDPPNNAGKTNPVIIAVVVLIILAAAGLLSINLLNKKKGAIK